MRRPWGSASAEPQGSRNYQLNLLNLTDTTAITHERFDGLLKLSALADNRQQRAVFYPIDSPSATRHR